MLSIDAGRIAPMAYHYHQQQPIGMANNGFANRNKGENVRKISIPSLPTISTSSYDDDISASLPTPRSSSRAQLLAGLRTAPKTPTSATAGFGDVNAGFENFQHAPQNQNRHNDNGLPLKSARSLGYGGLRGAAIQNTNNQSIPRSSPPQQSRDSYASYHQASYSGLPTPPASSANFGSMEEYETKVYAELLARNISLAQQQQFLQQQMRMVQQAQQLQQVQQQMQQFQIQSPVNTTFGTPPISPAVFSPSGGLQHNGIYGVYSPLATQFSFFPSSQNQYQQGPVPAAERQSPPPVFPASAPKSVTPPAIKTPAYAPPARRSPSPPKDYNNSEPVMTKKTPSPPPASSSAAFRRGHKKCSSLSSCINASALVADSGPKTSVPKLTNVPSTPLNSTFGGRGDHPIRQPRGPPSLEEIVAKPTTKHEGSKNFATRQRRRALTKLVNAGMERRSTKPSGTSSAGSMTPVSEHEIILSFEDVDSNTFAQGDSALSTPVSSADEGISMPKTPVTFKRRSGLRAPQMALDSAEKRKSAIF